MIDQLKKAPRLMVCPESVDDKDRISYRCDRGEHDKCSGLIPQTRERSKKEPMLRLCDCPEPSCTCQNRGKAAVHADV